MKRIFFYIMVVIAFTQVAVAADLEPEIVLRNGIDSIVKVLNDQMYSDASQKEARKEILFGKAEAIFDFDEFSRGALGRNWGRFSDTQRAEFTKYFSRLIANTYIAKIDDEDFQDLKIT